MSLLDRYIILKFLTNFVILFALVFLLATSIDVILQLDEFLQVVRARHGEGAGFAGSMAALVGLVVEFHGPRLFQIYAYLLGVVSVGAMGFTLAQMVRHRELVALLASGLSLYRMAWPILLAAFGLNLLHLVNSNVVLPRLAPLLIRGHGELAHAEMRAFPIPLTPDRNGTLLHAPAFHRETGTLERPTMIERDASGRIARRISAAEAQWDDSLQAWRLVNGQALIPVTGGEGVAEAMRAETVAFFPTDLSPRVLTVRRYREYARMLSPAQIQELIETSGAVDETMLARIQYNRYAVVLTNMLMLMITMPCFLLRQPGNLLRQSMLCASVALLIMLGGFIGMEVEFEALPPVAAVFLPVIVLLPLALAAVTWVKT